MRSVWKYPLRVADTQVVDLPTGAEPLAVQAQDGSLVLWAAVDTDIKEVAPVRLCVFGTGEQIEEDWLSLEHLATVQMDGLVWHVFREWPTDEEAAHAQG